MSDTTADKFRAAWTAARADYGDTGELIARLNLGDRLLRLLAVACARRVEHLAEGSGAVIDVSELYADGRATDEERASARASAWDSAWASAWDSAKDSAWASAWDAAWAFAWDSAWASAKDSAWDSIGSLFVAAVGFGWRFDPAWRTSTAVGVAQGIYQAKDWAACPILADALQDAGCPEDHGALAWLRSDAQKFRGCWVVDVILGKRAI